MRAPGTIANYSLAVVLAASIAFTIPATFAEQERAQVPQQKPKLPRARRLGQGVELRRDPATGELRGIPAKRAAGGAPAEARAAGVLRSRVGLVEISCNVLLPHATQVRGLGRDHFRVFEDGVEQAIAHFDASTEPASIALVMDASPSVFREWERMKTAARALARNLTPLDEVAVVAFAGEAHLLLPFSRDRALLESALASPELARVANVARSNIYEAVYFTARELFGGSAPRRGRKAIVLLSDGEDSGLGLSWDPASAAPRAGAPADRLTFEDVARALAAAGMEVYVVSTAPRPKALTDAWLEAHRSKILITPAARELAIAHYTLYLAELVRRVGGRLYFLREIGRLDDVYRRIAENLGAQYTLGYYPAAGLTRPGWRKLRVELRQRNAVAGAPRDARLTHRVAYYVPAEP